MFYLIGGNSRRSVWKRAAFGFFALACLSFAPAAFSQTWVGGADNQWFTGANWNPNTAPNGNSAVVSILNAANNPVILNSSAAVSTLTLGASNSLNITSGTLSIATSASNGGTIDANMSSAVFSLSGSGNSTNSGLLEASGGGTLNLIAAAVIDNAGGNITSTGAGSTVNLSTTIQGGTLNTSDGGVMQTSGGVVVMLDGQTHGAITLSDGSALTDTSNSITQIQGTLNLGTATGSIFTLSGALALSGNATLSGPGSLTMTGGQIGTNGSSQMLTNQSIIQGSGAVGTSSRAVSNNLTLGNSGTISANVSGQTLSVGATGSIANTGLLEATGGGLLILNFNSTSAILNSGGNITSTGTGSTIFVSTTIQGGTLNTSNGGVIQTSGSPGTLDGQTLGAITISDGSTYTASNSATFLMGTLNLGMVAGGTLALTGHASLSGNTTLSGPGSLTMTGGTLTGDGYALTNQSTIQGSGSIFSASAPLNNSGTIDANVNGSTLTLTPLSTQFNNTGRLEATGGGSLDFEGSAGVYNNSGGTITAAGAGSSVTFGLNGNSSDPIVIQGGTLTTSSGGVIQSYYLTLDGQTHGAITLSDGSALTDTSTSITQIQGTLNLGTATGSTFTLNGSLALSGNAILSGPGSLTMTGALIGTNGSSETLTNQSTIQGSGAIGAFSGTLSSNVTLSNSGTIDANVSGQSLSVGATGSIANTGLLEATGGGLLILNFNSNSAIVNSGGNITSTGTGSTIFVSTTIQGGTLNTSNGGVIQTSGSPATLDGGTHGAITISDGSTYTASNSATFLMGILNLGTVTGGTLALDGFAYLSGNTTLSGPGSLTMTGGQIGAAFSPEALTNRSTIQGSGVIGSSGGPQPSVLTVGNIGTIAANVLGQTLTIAAGGGIINNGLLAATGGGALQVTSTLANFNSVSGVLTGNYKVDGSGGNQSTLQIYSLGSAGGEVITLGDGTTTSSITLNGTNANTLFTDAAGKNPLALGTISANASLTAEGGYTLSTPGALNTAGNVTIGGSGSELNVNGAYTQTAGATWIESGGTLSATAFNLEGGTAQVDGTIDPPSSPSLIDVGTELFGTGDIVGDVISSGEIFPGDDPDPGTFTINGNYEETSTGSLVEDIGGTEASPIPGLLDVIGNVQLDPGATLDIGTPAFAPGVYQTFEILSYTGTFSGTFQLTGADAGDFRVLYDSGNVELEYLPEPASFWLTLSFLACLPLLHRFRVSEKWNIRYLWTSSAFLGRRWTTTLVFDICNGSPARIGIRAPRPTAIPPSPPIEHRRLVLKQRNSQR